MNTRKLAVGIVSLAVIAGVGAWALPQPPKETGKARPEAKEKEGEEQVITLDKAPEAVRAAAVKVAGDAKNITKVTREEDEEDIATYEVEYTEGGAACSAVFSPAGDLMEQERSIAEAKLPAAAMAALKKEFPKATFEKPESVTKMYYEVVVVIDGKKHGVKVDAAGEIEDEHEEHGEGHEKGEKGEKDHKDKH
jgi:hypothetical protein